MNFKIDDILVCKKTSFPDSGAHWKITNRSPDWRPNIDMLQGFEYIVIAVDESDIMAAMKIQWDNRDRDVISSEVEFFGFEDTRVNHWEKWFYTKAELRERQLNLLGI